MTTRSTRLGVVMDPIDSIKPVKDSTFAMLLAAQRRGFRVCYMEQKDLFLRNGEAFARMQDLQVRDDTRDWFSLGESALTPMGELDVILMRKDPPFDMEYIATTYILERAAHGGALVVNEPGSLRDVNEKAYTAWFPDLCPPTLITRSHKEMLRFAEENERIVVKPLDGMGGKSIFVVNPDDPNRNVIMETLTDNQQRFAIAQKYVPEITTRGDVRILLVNGEPVPYGLARIPVPGEHRGNLAAGGRGVGVALTARDREICARVGPAMVAKGLIFVGIDVIGDFMTEINVTSPTCIRELDAEYGLDIAGDLMAAIEERLAAGPRD